MANNRQRPGKEKTSKKVEENRSSKNNATQFASHEEKPFKSHQE